MSRRTVDLSCGGESWRGWYLGPWGRAREWRLHSPDGQDFCAFEIARLHDIQHSESYLQDYVRMLEKLASPDAVHFTVEEAAVLVAAAEIIEHVRKLRMPRLPMKRWARL